MTRSQSRRRRSTPVAPPTRRGDESGRASETGRFFAEASQSAAPTPAQTPALTTAADPAGDDIPPRPEGPDQARRVHFHCLRRRAWPFGLFPGPRTISKKPPFLRQVLSPRLAPPAAGRQRRRGRLKAAVVLAIVEVARCQDRGARCGRGGLLFRAVAPGDVQKKSTLSTSSPQMLLPGGDGTVEIRLPERRRSHRHVLLIQGGPRVAALLKKFGAHMAAAERGGLQSKPGAASLEAECTETGSVMRHKRRRRRK